MSPGVRFLHDFFALAAAIWLAGVVLALPFLLSPEPVRGRRSWGRIAILGALCPAAGFLLLAADQAYAMSGTSWGLTRDTWAMALEDSARTLSSGAAILVIAVLAVATTASVRRWTRFGAWRALLLLLVLLALVTWRLAAVAPETEPVDVYMLKPFDNPKVGPAAWLDLFSRDLLAVTPWGMLVSVVGMIASWRSFRQGQARALPDLRESGCDALALFGLLALSFAILELEMAVRWTADDQWRQWLAWQGIPDLIDSGVLIRDYIDFPRPWLPVAVDVTVAILGLAAVLFGEFHLRGRRVLREPEPAAAATGAP